MSSHRCCLVIVRIIQGLAFGAEWGGAILMAYEHAPWRAKGRFTGIVQAGFPVGLLLANLVFLFSVHLGGSLAWRIPFLSSIVLVVVGLIIRSKVPESPVFEEVKESGTVAKSPILDSIRYDWRNILRGICLRVAETAGYAVSITYMISYLNTNHLTTRTQTLLSLCLAAAIGIGATLAWGRLTDRIGRRPQYVVVCAFGIVWGVLMFTLVNTGAFVVIMLTLVISYTVSQNALAGAQGGWFPELFTAARRASGASMAYQISAMVSGFTPFITTLLYVKFGWAGPALLFSCYALIGLIAALATRETYGRRERRLAAEASASAAPVHVSVDHPLPETSELQTPLSRPGDHRPPRPSIDQGRRDHHHTPPPAATRPRSHSSPTGCATTSSTWERSRARAMSARPSARPTCSPRSTPTGSATVPTTRTGTGVTASCSPPATTPSASTPRSPKRGSCRSPSSPRTAPTTPGSRCQEWPATPLAWRSPADRSATDSRSRSACVWDCAIADPAPGSTTSSPTAS